MNTVERAARHVATTAGAARQPVQQQAYQDQARRATANPLEQAAEALCVVAFCPLTETMRAGLMALFERRLRRAYLGALA